MALVLNEDQIMLKDAARDFLQNRAPVSHLRELRDTDNCDGFSRELWGEMTDLGWPGIVIPEDHGGFGFGYTGLGIVLEECGRTLTPSPLHSSAMAGAAALLRAGTTTQRAEMLPEVAAGKRFIALAVDETLHHRPHECHVKTDKTATGYRLSGSKNTVIDGHFADTLIVSASNADSSGLSLFLVPADAAGVNIEPMALFDTHHAANIHFDNVALEHTMLLGTPDEGALLLDYILDVARIAQCAEMLGIAQEAFERTMNYLRERKQFGVPIGSFQGLQHRAAIMYGDIEMAKSVTLHALHALDDDHSELPRIASMTKARLCETTHNVAAEGIQMHGGIGMTDEYDIGFFLKRCQILETVYGDRYYHLDRYARLRGY